METESFVDIYTMIITIDGDNIDEPFKAGFAIESNVSRMIINSCLYITENNKRKNGFLVK